jgi:hypothetical protein
LFINSIKVKIQYNYKLELSLEVDVTPVIPQNSYKKDEKCIEAI